MCFFSYCVRWMWIEVRFGTCPPATPSVASHLALHVSSRTRNLPPFTDAIMQIQPIFMRKARKRTWKGDTDHVGVYLLITDERVTRHSDFGIR